MLARLQVTLAGSLAGILEDKKALALIDPQVVVGATTHLAGAVIGAILRCVAPLLFGRPHRLRLAPECAYR